MISLDTLRAALLADDPYTQIDRLVRAELAGGRTTGQVFDGLQPPGDGALDSRGLSEDGEEALLGALDALTGDCPPDCRYHDVPAPGGPTFPAATGSLDRVPDSP